MFKGEIFIKFLYKKYSSLLLVMLVCIVIFLFSAQPGSESSKISDNFFIRKLGHFSEYAVLGFFVFAYFSNVFTKYIHKNKYRVAIITSLLFSMLYAATDEFHQTFVPGRDGNFRDVLIDSSGALVGIIISSVLYYFLFLKNKS